MKQILQIIEPRGKWAVTLKYDNDDTSWDEEVAYFALVTHGDGTTTVEPMSNDGHEIGLCIPDGAGDELTIIELRKIQ